MAANSARRLLDRRYRDRQRALVDGVARVLGTTLLALPDLSQDSIDAYVARAYPTVAGGQNAAATNAAGYMTALVRPTTRGRRATINVGLALLRSGVLVTPDSRSLVAPMLRARRWVADGETSTKAILAAASYANALSSNDLARAQRVGLDTGAEASGAKITGWLKDPGGDACEWCQTVSGQTYSSPEDVPFHDRDRCSVIPDLEGDELAEYWRAKADEDIPF